jgi:N-methylhydantoinase B
LPGVRVVEQGTPSQTLIDLIEANIRLPRTGIGDLNAGLAATAIGEARVREACERYGADLVLATFAHVLDHGEQIARAELRKIPNGTYRASGVIDGDGVSDAEIPIAVTVTVGDDFLHADFGGCAPQTRGPVNCSTGALLSACKTVVRAITAPRARSNDGFFRPFSLTVPPGTIFSAEPPAPTGWYYEGAAFANDLMWRALAPVVPDRLGAGSYTSLCCSYVVGTDAAGELFVLAEPNVGGWGGSAGGDGASALIATTDGDTYNFPVEVVESRFPVLVERYALNTDEAGGAGQRRGGFGVVREYRIHGAESASGYCSVSGWQRRPWPLGGEPGTNNYVEYVSGDRCDRHGRIAHVDLADGDLVRSVTGGGGGYGDPFEREPELVRDDVLDGYVTTDEARSRYGVALDPETGALDAAATAGLRAR